MSAQPSSSVRSLDPHLHLSPSRCPTCDQPIANEKLNEISEQLKAREEDLTRSIREKMSQDFAARLTQVQTDAEAELRRVANDNAASVAKLKLDAIASEAAVRLEAESAFKEQLAETTRQRQTAEDARIALQAQFDAHCEASDAALARAKEEATAREAAARIEITAAAEARLEEKVAEAALLRHAAEQNAANKLLELEELRETSSTTIESLKSEVITREASARTAAAAEANTLWRAQLEESDRAKEAAETQLAALAASRQEWLNEHRVALEKAKDDAVNAEKAKAFDEKLKLETQLKDMARKLEKKTADELGEGAEVKLLDELKERFGEDTFMHVGKGNAGADIIQEIMHNGKLCGKIVIDSKDRNAWRNEYVSKLRQDQVAAQANHSILSSRVMPAGTKQLHIQDGVIVANPARVLILVELLRQQMIITHKLRLSNESKAEKTATLYAFITSDLCSQLFSQIESRAADMEELEVKEKTAHDNVWKRRGVLIRSIQKSRADLYAQIEMVLGSRSDDTDTEEYAAHRGNSQDYRLARTSAWQDGSKDLQD